jgi:hypothetical protein
VIDFEYFGSAKEFLHEALFHAKSFDDKLTKAKCYHYLASIAYKECDFEVAARMEQEALNVGEADCEFWTQCVQCLADYLIIQGKPLDAESVLNKAIELVKRSGNTESQRNFLGMFTI